MDAFILIWRSLVGTPEAVSLALFLVFFLALLFANWSVKRGAHLSLRPIPGYATLKTLLGRAAEAGRPAHLSLGTSGIGDRFTADTSAALSVLEYLAERGAVNATPPIVTLAHPTVLPVAQDFLRRAYTRQGYPEEYDPTRARFVAPDPAVYASNESGAFAYAAGTMRLIKKEKLAANVMVGRFGDEFLLLGEAGTQNKLEQIGGTSVTDALPFVYATMTHPLVGEEIYAAGAYLSNKISHISSLLAQDLMRWFLIICIGIAILLKPFM